MQRFALPSAVFLTLLAAQPAGAQAVVKGQIRAVQTQAPLAMAEVLLENLNIRVWTNDSGYFRIPNIPLGTHQFRVRRIGFEGAVASLKVETADSLILALELAAWIPELEEIYVKAPRRSRLVQEIDQRRRMGFGRFLMPEDLRDNDHLTLTDLVRRLGVEVVYSPLGSDAIAIGRSSGPSGIGGDNFKCDLQVLLNGVAVQTNNLNLFQVNQLDAVEIYRSATEAPIEYIGTGRSCGIILLWSRSS